MRLQDQMSSEIKQASNAVRERVLSKLLELDPGLTAVVAAKSPDSPAAKQALESKQAYEQEELIANEIRSIMEQEGLDPDDPAVRFHFLLCKPYPSLLLTAMPFFYLY